MPRSKPINFIPTSTNFSDLEKNLSDPELSIEDVLPASEDDLSGLWLEKTILTMMAGLPTDRERAILLLLILRGYGFNFDHKSIARLFGVTLRWYYRIVQGIRKKLAAFNLA